MPIPQPPSRQTAAPPAATGLSRTRSLRRPQATGLPGASTTTTTASSSTASTTSRMPTKLGSTTAPAKNTSPTRLPSKPTRAIPSAPTRLRTAAPASTASSTSTTSATRTAKPPSSSRTHLLGPSAPQAAPPPGTTTVTTRRPSSSSGRPLSSGGVPASPGGSRTTSGSGPTATARGHARTRSTSAVTSAASTSPTSPTRRVPPGTGPARPTRHPLTAAPVLRPPSAQSVQSSSGGSSAGVRAAVTGRAPSGSSTAAARAPSRTQREAPAAPASARPRTRDGAAAKPAFNTLQQHYSPAKNAAPKPRVAAILAPPASPSKKPANVALSAETSRLQTHLLQLHILHRDAADVSADWHASARHVLIDTRFAALADDHAELAQITARRAEAANATALQEWASFRGDNGMTLEEKIQVLDEVLAGVWSLAGESHSSHASHASHPATSRYAQVVRRFERWAQKTAAQVEARRGIESLNDLDDLSDDDEGAAALLLSNENEPLLGASWYEECGQLARRLQGWQRQLEMLGRGVLDGNQSTNSSDREAQPSLVRMLSGCTGLVVGMLEELRVMQQLEREAAEQELAWVRRINAAAGVGGDGQLEGDTNKARAGAIWRAI